MVNQDKIHGIGLSMIDQNILIKIYIHNFGNVWFHDISNQSTSISNFMK